MRCPRAPAGCRATAVRTGEVDALLLGDIEREAGAAILSELRRRPEFASAAGSFDVVKTPHHGSANISPALMEAIRAPVGIVSVGADDDYGHPPRIAKGIINQCLYLDQQGPNLDRASAWIHRW